MREKWEKAGEIKRALLRKALGETLLETQEEYGIGDDGEEVLKRRKVTRKEIPPDLAAVKILLSEGEEKEDFSSMTDAELAAYTKDLARLLREIEEKEPGGERPGENAPVEKDSGEYPGGWDGNKA